MQSPVYSAALRIVQRLYTPAYGAGPAQPRVECRVRTVLCTVQRLYNPGYSAEPVQLCVYCMACTALCIVKGVHSPTLVQGL